RFTSGPSTHIGPVEVDRLAERLSGSKNQFLALTARRSVALDAESRLVEESGVTLVRLDQALIRHMREIAQEKNAKWEAIVKVDAEGRNGRRWATLCSLAEQASKRLKAELLTTPGTVLASQPGLLERYGCVGLIDEIRRDLER